MALVAFAGCDGVFGLSSVPPLPPDAGSGGPADVAPDAPPCVMPVVHDSFDSLPTCGSWGAAFGDDTGTTATAMNSTLVIQPGFGGDGTASHGGCIAPGQSSFSAGFFMQVKAPPAGNEYLTASLYFATTDVTVHWTATAISLTQGGTERGNKDFDPLKTTWVRVRPADDALSVVAETSPDGRAWTRFAEATVAAPPDVTISIIGGLFATPMTPPSPIVIDGMNVCP